MRWIVVIAAMAAKRQRTDAQQCDESALPVQCDRRLRSRPEDGHAIDARVYAPAAKETFLRQKPGPSRARTTRSPASSPTAAA